MDGPTRPTLLVIAEDLQFDSEVDLAHLDGPWHREHDGGEVEDAGDTGLHQPVGGILRSSAGRCDNTDVHALGLHDLGQLVDVAHAHTTKDRAHLGLVDVDDAADREASLAEAPIPRKGLPEVAGADDDHWPVVSEAQLATHLVHQIVDLVAHAAGAVAAQV